MSMIQCSECGNEVSDKALTCPHCGSTVELMVKLKKFFWWGWKIAFITLGAMALIAVIIIAAVKFFGV